MSFTPVEWKTIDQALEADPERYGLPDVNGYVEPRIFGEHKMWGLTFWNVVFSKSGPIMAGSSLSAMIALVSGGCVGSPEGP